MGIKNSLIGGAWLTVVSLSVIADSDGPILEAIGGIFLAISLAIVVMFILSITTPRK